MEFIKILKYNEEMECAVLWNNIKGQGGNTLHKEKEMHLLFGNTKCDHHSKSSENEIPLWENRTLTYSQRFRYSLVGVKKERGGLIKHLMITITANILPPAYQIFNGEKTKIFSVEYAITNGVVNGSEAIGIKNMLPGDLDIPKPVENSLIYNQGFISQTDLKEHIHLSENKVNIDLLKVIELTAFIYNFIITCNPHINDKTLGCAEKQTFII
ncbi:hypothetical protein ACJX0J_010434 [Zea mays]